MKYLIIANIQRIHSVYSAKCTQSSIGPIFLILFFVFGSVACSPRIEVTTPTTPITINLNVKIDHEIHINVDKQVDALLQQNSDVF